MIPHIVFEALIKHDMYRTAPAKFRFITCPLARIRRTYCHSFHDARERPRDDGRGQSEYQDERRVMVKEALGNRPVKQRVEKHGVCNGFGGFA